MYKVVLASQSPRRKQLLEQMGVEFDIWPSKLEEKITSTKPEEVCVELCKQKALDVASQILLYNAEHPDLTTPQDILVIGADTVVAVQEKDEYEILGKPKSEEEAHKMLCKLSDAKHKVYTGVCLAFITKEGRVGEKSFFEVTDVFFGPVSDIEIDEYIATGEPMDKAGAYGIQGSFAKYVKKIDGDFYNVMGMPISRIHYELKELGVEI